MRFHREKEEGKEEERESVPRVGQKASVEKIPRR
jgi:hypothetical protein